MQTHSPVQNAEVEFVLAWSADKSYHKSYHPQPDKSRRDHLIVLAKPQIAQISWEEIRCAKGVLGSDLLVAAGDTRGQIKRAVHSFVFQVNGKT